MTKTCIKCHSNKLTTDFYKHPTTMDGLLPVCKQCQKERSKLSQQTNKERHKNSSRKWREKTKSPWGTWKKNCPTCGSEQVYSTKYALQTSINENWGCHKCNGGRLPLSKTIWKRTCPKCGKEIVYSSNGNLKRAIKNNSNCCEGYKYPRTQAQMKLIHKMAIKRKEYIGPKHHFFGKHLSEETKEKISKSATGKSKGPISEETRRKHRIHNLTRLTKLGIGSAIDNGSIEWFEKYNENTNSNFKPKRFFDVGYDADGYDSDKHIWIEYDTPYHMHRCQKKKDIIRERRIIKHFEDLGEPLSEFKRVLAYKSEELITTYRGYEY